MKKFPEYLKNGKIINIVLVVVIAAGAFWGGWAVLNTLTGRAAVSETGFYLDPETGTFAPGEKFNVALKVNTNQDEVNVAAAYLKFNKDQLELKSVKRNTANQDTAVSPIFESDLGSTANVSESNQNGELAVVGLTGDQYHDTNGWFKGEGTLATLTFAGKKAGVTAEVSFDKAKSSIVKVAGNSNILDTATGGRYTIGQAGNQPSITLDPSEGTYKVNQDFKVKAKINSLDNEINVAACYFEFDPEFIKVKNVKRYTANQNVETPIFESDMGSSTDLNQVNQSGELAVVGLTGDAYHNEHGWFKGEGTLADITFEGLKNDAYADVDVLQSKSSLVKVDGNTNILGYIQGGKYQFSEYAVSELTAKIKSPQNGAAFLRGDAITFEGEVSGNTPAASSLSATEEFKWTSDKDGEIGTELKFDKDNLSLNDHKITFEVTQNNKKASDSVSISVREAGISEDGEIAASEDEDKGFLGNLPTSGIVIGVIILIALIATVVIWAFSRRKLKNS
ncbi:cohesin domain-containing protein [Patescibacteria group bacterium]